MTPTMSSAYSTFRDSPMQQARAGRMRQSRAPESGTVTVGSSQRTSTSTEGQNRFLVSLQDRKMLPCEQLFQLLDMARLSDDDDITLQQHPVFGLPDGQSVLKNHDQQIAKYVEHNRQDLVAINSRQIQPIIRSVLPDSFLSGKAASAYSQTHKSAFSDYLQLLAYGASNNLAGIQDIIPQSMTFQFLEPLVVKLLSQQETWRMPGTRIFRDILSSKSMAETLFMSAVEAGNLEFVAGLLRYGDAEIDVNRLVCTVHEIEYGPRERACAFESTVLRSRYVKYTPVERAAALQHVEVTKLLIEHGADIQRSYKYSTAVYDPKGIGALECAIYNSLGGQSPNGHLVTELLRAGASVHSCILQQLLSVGNLDLAETLIFVRLDRSHREWLADGILHDAISRMPTSSALNLVERLQALGVNFDYICDKETRHEEGRPPIRKKTEFPPHLIDIAAQRGELLVVKRLRAFGANLTMDSLVAAIMSQNEDLVKILLQEGARVNCYSDHFRTSPFGQFVLSKNATIRSLLEDYGCTHKVTDRYQFLAALSAAATIGDIKLMEGLLKLRISSSAELLGYALTRAVNGNHNEAAFMLLDCGASLSALKIKRALGQESFLESSFDPDWRSMNPLWNAVSHRNVPLVRALLDHGAGEVETRTNGATGTMREAIEWGDRQIIEDLLFAGISVHIDALNVAIEKRDTMLLHLLAGFTSNINENNPLYHRMGSRQGPPLGRALLNEDSEMVCQLIDLGADISLCEDQILQLMDASPPLFHHCLQIFKDRYPYGKPGFGSRLLEMAMFLDRSDLVRVLLEFNCAHGKAIFQTMEIAIQKCADTSLDIIRALLSKGMDLDTPLGEYSRQIGEHSWEIGEHSWEIGEYSLETPLLIAIKTNRYDIVEFLLQAGADVNLPATKGITHTPLQQAARSGSKAMVQLLLNYGADVNASPSKRNGGTALQLAAKMGAIGVAELLYRYGSNYLALGSQVNGRTALEGAAENGRLDMVKYLTDLGPHPDSQYDSSIRFARKNGHNAAADLLKLVQARERQETRPGPLERITAVAEPQRLYTCGVCGMPASNASALRRHERSKHGDDHPHKCKICTKTFPRKDTLDRHVETHSESLYECPRCLKVFSRHDTLTAHEKKCNSTGEVVRRVQDVDDIVMTGTIPW